MPPASPRRAIRAAHRGTWALLVTAALALAGCSSSGPAGLTISATQTGSASASGSVSGSVFGSVFGSVSGHAAAGNGVSGGHAPLRIDAAHIHAAVREPGTGDLLIATHEGLLRSSETGLERVGPGHDLMGFAVAADGSYYASGHPARGSDLPDPLGLIRSTDRGLTWQPLGRAGESDFHALAVGGWGVAGFDGRLRTSPDGATWTTVTPPAPPYALSIAPGTGHLLGTTESGLVLSQDRGATWRTVDVPGLLVLVAWADDRTVVGVTTRAEVLVSRDAGATWQRTAPDVGRVTSLSASAVGGTVETIMVRGGEVLASTDLGATLAPAH